MLPSRLEYLLVLVTLAIGGGALFPKHLSLIIKRREFWCAYFVFLLVATVIDLFALNLGWWSFTPAETCGVYILSIPVEEFVLFSLMFLLVVTSWEAFEADEF